MRFATIVALSVLLGTVGCFGAVPPAVKAMQPTTHLLAYVTISKTGTCSATAIGPHALLTASHCEAPSDVIELDGTQHPKIVRIIRDNLDHSIYLLDGITFDHYATVNYNAMAPGDDVFVFGNPADNVNFYRKGAVAGVRPYEFMKVKLPEMMLDMNIYYGDSGAGIFNEKGELVGVISQLEVEKEYEVQFVLAGAFPLLFDDADYAAAKSYGVSK